MPRYIPWSDDLPDAESRVSQNWWQTNDQKHQYSTTVYSALILYVKFSNKRVKLFLARSSQNAAHIFEAVDEAVEERAWLGRRCVGRHETTECFILSSVTCRRCHTHRQFCCLQLLQLEIAEMYGGSTAKSGTQCYSYDSVFKLKLKSRKKCDKILRN